MFWNKLPLPSFPEISILEPWQTQAQMKCLDQDIWVAWLDEMVGSSFQVPSLAWDFFIWRDTGPTVGPHVWNRKAAFENTAIVDDTATMRQEARTVNIMKLQCKHFKWSSKIIA